MEKITRLFDFLYDQQQRHPLEKSMGYACEGQWIWWSTEDLVRESRQLALGLLAQGLKPGDRVVLADTINRPEWVVADLACQLAGLVSVPVYPTISAREYAYIFRDAGVSAAFIGGGELVDRVRNAAGESGFDRFFTFQPTEGCIYWRDLLLTDIPEGADRQLGTAAASDLATIIYTSGTTGDPKGVMLDHASIVFNVLTILPMIPIEPGMRAISFLPLCHSFERAVSFAFLYAGISVSFTTAERLGGEDGDLQNVRPHFFTTVPRLLEKVYERIYQRGLSLSPVKRWLFFRGLKHTESYAYDRTYIGWVWVWHILLDRLVFAKWRAALGGEVRGIITGAAPCSLRIAQMFSAAGIPIREGYGLTEAAPGICISRFAPGMALLGTVGPPIDGVEVWIDLDEETYGPGAGEILSSGPNQMIGYYHKPEEDQQVFRWIDGKRWLCTGDVGRWVTGRNGVRFLQITDRKKELMKTSGGKYVAPAPIESRLKEDFLIDQAMVVGDNRKYVTALILPAVEALEEWCRHKGIQWTTLEEMVEDPQVVDKYHRIIDRVNLSLGKVEQVKKFRLLPVVWESQRSDGTPAELTPTLKLKRRVIQDKYAGSIENLYS